MKFNIPMGKVIPQNVSLLNIGMQVVDLVSETCVPFSGINVCSNIAGGLPRDMYFGAAAKDVDIVVYGRDNWAMLNDHDEFFNTLEDNLHYMFDGDCVNMTDDTSGAVSSQPDNSRVYRVYACDKGLVNIIFYQGCHSVGDVVAKFDNTINAFWVDQVGPHFNGLRYDGMAVTAIANPARVTTPERDQRMRDKAVLFGLYYQDYDSREAVTRTTASPETFRALYGDGMQPVEIPVRSTGMSPLIAAPYGAPVDLESLPLQTSDTRG